MTAPVPPSSAGPPAARPGGDVRPRLAWVVLAVVLMVAGPGGCTVALVAEGIGLLDDVDRWGSVRLPTEGAPITIDEPVDRVTLYVRGRRAADARLVGDVELAGPDGEPVVLRLPSVDFTFDHPDGGVVTAAFEFRAEEAGTYRLDAAVDPAGEGIEMSVGPAVLESVGPVVAVAFALGALSALAGLVLLVVVLVRRGRSRRELRGPPPGWVPPPPVGGGPPPPPGWSTRPPDSTPPPSWGPPPGAEAPPPPPPPSSPPPPAPQRTGVRWRRSAT